MHYRQLGNSPLKCSVIGLGTWAMGGDAYGKVDDQVSIDTIHAAVDAGINLIDTAPVYGAGHSEEVVGRGIKGIRDKVILATKCGNNRTPDGGYERNGDPQQLRRDLENSLRRLDVDTIDLFQFHWPDATRPIAPAFAELEKMRKEGKIRAIGVSNFSCAQMDEVRAVCELASLQPPYSLLDRDFEAELMPYCVEHNIGILSYGSIGAGVLTGKFKERPIFPETDTRSRFYAKFFTEEAWPKTAALVDVLSDVAASRGKPTVHAAINWVLAQPGMTVALVGAKTPEQVRMNAEAGSWEMTAEEVARIEEAYQKVFA